MKLIKLFAYFVLLVVLVLGVLIFTSANDSTITVNYLLGEYTGLLSFILGVVFFVGFFLGLILCIGFHFVNRSKLLFARRKVSALEAKVQQLEFDLKTKDL